MEQSQRAMIDKVALAHIVQRGVWFTDTGKPFLVNWGGKRNIKPDGVPETDLETLVREIMEEGSVRVIPETVQHLVTLEGKALDGRNLKEAFYLGDFEGTPVPSGEVKQFVRLTSANIGAQNMTPMGNTFLRWMAAKGYID